MLLALLYFEATEAVLLYLVSGVALKVETSRWLSSGKLVAPKEDNIHPDPEGCVAGHYIFDLVRILVELQVDVVYGVIVTGQLYPFLHAQDEAGPQCFLIGGA